MRFAYFNVVLFGIAKGSYFASPTDALADAIQHNGMSPRPTGKFELLKRQSSDETLCGYIEGHPGMIGIDLSASRR